MINNQDDAIGYSLYSNKPIEITLNEICFTCENDDCPKRKIIKYIFEGIEE